MFFQVNVRTAMSVGQASGLALAEAAAAGCDVVQYTPNQVKNAVAGWGGADKAQVQKMVQARLGSGRAARAGRRRRRRRAGAVPPGDGADAPHASQRGGGAMIGSLRGTVLERTERCRRCWSRSAVSATSCHGHAAHAGRARAASPAFLYVHHHIREDAQTLFGFLHRDERATFQVLIATHGVGPALAMAILGTHSPSALVDIVATDDIGALTLVPGVGKKTAERLLVELRNRLDLPMLDPVGGRRRRRPAARVVGDVREALAGLGYGPDEIRDALRELPSDGDAVDAAARRAEAAGGQACVTSSSTRTRSPSTRRSTRSVCGRGGSASSSASAS